MIYDFDTKKYLAHRPVTALRPWMRLRGMIGRRFEDFDAMVFPRCNAIHSCFMAMPFDAVFVDGNNRVVRCCEAVAPWKLYLGAAGASCVIELPAGAIRAAEAKPGDRLNLGSMVGDGKIPAASESALTPEGAADGCSVIEKMKGKKTP